MLTIHAYFFYYYQQKEFININMYLGTLPICKKISVQI